MSGLHFFVFVIFSSALVIGFAVGLNFRPSIHQRKGDSSPRVKGTIHLNVNDGGSIRKNITCFTDKGNSVRGSGRSGVNYRKEEEDDDEGTSYEPKYGGYSKRYGGHGSAPIQGCGRGGGGGCNSADGSSVKGGDRTIKHYPYQAPVYPN
ncbi:unnamed protein product [Taenia asiatica]|uniref:Glycine-rich protein n=1 Tax=Taenia asiatica TaxID=60517 RepID=A0A0R3VXT0_TAEAS|nr:unnamed protein product [Taenia asiatica]